jgi:hypothetical protein
MSDKVKKTDITHLILGMVADAPVDPDHFDQKCNDQGRTDQKHKTGGKKCHDKRKRIRQLIRGYEQIQAEQEKKYRHKKQQYLKNPPCMF